MYNIMVSDLKRKPEGGNSLKGINISSPPKPNLKFHLKEFLHCHSFYTLTEYFEYSKKLRLSP
jgi:hypothetical protein